MKYTKTLFSLCAAAAMLTMTASAAAVDEYTGFENVCINARICEVTEQPREQAKVTSIRVEPSYGQFALLAADNNNDTKKRAKSKVSEKRNTGWTIYASIGGGVLVVAIMISLIAEQKKK